jgi:hypothetical protein
MKFGPNKEASRELEALRFYENDGYLVVRVSTSSAVLHILENH